MIRTVLWRTLLSWWMILVLGIIGLPIMSLLERPAEAWDGYKYICRYLWDGQHANL